FHYGRWACPAGVGWVWVPDTCWGPSWVSWRYSSSYCGWAPLPPSACWVAGVGFCHNNVAVGFGFEFGLHSSDYVFVSSGALTSHHPTYLSSSHATSVFKDTTVANNYVTVNNTKVVNKGVGFERIAHATRGNVRQVALKDTTDVRSTTPRRETLDPDGKTLNLSRPPLTASASPGSSAMPSTTKGAPTHVNVHPRADRNVASLAPNTASSSSGSDSLQSSSFTGTVTPRGTYLSPRISSSPAVKPSTVTTPTTAKPDLNSAPGNSAAPRNGVPIRGGYTRGGRPDAPVVGGNTVATPNTSPGRSESAPYYSPPGPVRGNPGPVRPGPSGGAPAYGAPSVNHAAPSVRPSISSPRVEAYRAPAPAPTAPTAPAPAAAAPAAPAARSAPAASSSQSSGGRSGAGGTDGGGGRGSR
ncbi:MAG TPA: DUF6600 domain-containing protein, partial [Candidatus Dormibacteraeota bacterium]|nr:DUF6600 domain-containing protein [Candidatus Dormibacteraeota bacterium]